MDTIQTYIDSVFANVENTPEMRQLKEEITHNMLDKYEDLIQSGASEHEALGKVIAEFGNIEELVEEFNFQKADINHSQTKNSDYSTDFDTVTENQLVDYFDAKTNSILLTAIATFIIIASVSMMMMLFGIFGSDGTFAPIIGVSLILIAVTIAVLLYIVADQRTKAYKYIEKANFFLAPQLKTQLEKTIEDFRQTYSIAIGLGVALIILPIIPLIIVSILEIGERFIFFGVSGMLIGVAAAVFIFIYFGTMLEMYEKVRDHAIDPSISPTQYSNIERREKVKGLLDNVYWPLIMVIYFLWSFSRNSWGYSWIIFIIAGIFESSIKSIFNIPEDD